MQFSQQSKRKAVTFSYDDGITQDIRLVELLNKYNLKCTFNLNSQLLGRRGILDRNGLRVSHYKLHPEDVAGVYQGHEVAAHTLLHRRLTLQSDQEVIDHVEQDRLQLSELVGYEVTGLAYPYGVYDDRVAQLIRNHTGIRYCRTTEYTDSFDPQADLYRLKANAFHLSFDKLMKLGQEFIRLDADKPQIFYIWGHAYEMDQAPENWQRLEEFFKLISGRKDIFYGTNQEIFL